MKTTRIIAGIAITLCASACVKQTSEVRTVSTQSPIERGRYLANIGGCNDCHTAGYALKAGQVEEKDWLMGDHVGWQGPWGTTYPANLRLYFQKHTEEDWLRIARTTELRPPMPWYELRLMTDEDLRAIYQFIRSLGAAGEPVPAYLPPGTEAPAPKFHFVLPVGPPPGTAPDA